MERKKRSYMLLRKFIVLSVFLLAALVASAQKRFELYAGMGAFELFHVGANYQFDRLSVGISAGYSYDDACTDVTFSGNVYYYMFGKSKHTEKYPWFVRLGVTHVTTDEDAGQSSFTALSPRFGREFYLFKEGGFRADVGLNYCFLTDENESGGVYLDANEIAPAMSVTFFYRF